MRIETDLVGRLVALIKWHAHIIDQSNYLDQRLRLLQDVDRLSEALADRPAITTGDDLIERLRAAYNAWNNPPSEGLPTNAGCVIEAADRLEQLAKERDYAVRWANRSVDQVKEAIDDLERQLADARADAAEVLQALKDLLDAYEGYDRFTAAAREAIAKAEGRS